METATMPTPFEVTIELTDDQFWQLCQNNRDLRFERNASGDLIIMPPTGSETGNRNIKLSTQLEIWSRQNNLGLALYTNS
jgi:Uma2 family endonuclease